jgi:hypothetical protein
MDKDIKERINKITGGAQCLHDFCCLEEGFDKHFEAKGVGLKDYLECVGEDASFCQFSTSYGGAPFCSCPLRIYMHKRLVK